MRFFGIAFLSLFLALQASAGFSFGRGSMSTGFNGNTSGMGATGEGVGAGFLSCGCAEQIIAKRTVRGDPCDTYARLHVHAVTGQGSVTPAVAPASPQAGHQLR